MHSYVINKSLIVADLFNFSRRTALQPIYCGTEVLHDSVMCASKTQARPAYKLQNVYYQYRTNDD